MTLDNTGKGKDRAKTQPGQKLQAGSEQPSSVEQWTSKIEEGKQYGGGEVKKLVEDALSADGRVQKDRADKAEAELSRLNEAHTGLTTQFQTVSQQVGQLLKEHDEREAESVKDDPVALGSLRTRQANRAEALRLESIKATHDAREAKIIARETEVNKRLTTLTIRSVATEIGVDEQTLADLVPDGNAERLKKAANILKQSGLVTQSPGGKPPGLTNRPASAISAGGETKTTAERMLDKAKKK